MFFSKKEDKKKLPDLPPPRGPIGGAIMNPPVFESHIDDSSLPSFPDSPDHNRFSQAAIKDAVSAGEETEEENYEDKDSVTEVEEWKPSNFKANLPKKKESIIEESEEEIEEEQEEDETEEEIEEPLKFVKREPESFGDMRINESRKRSEDIFVKLDKFHSARRSLQEIKEKLDEMNSLLRRIREVKLREEQELAVWDKEMIQIKSRIKHVTENIFEKVD